MGASASTKPCCLPDYSPNDFDLVIKNDSNAPQGLTYTESRQDLLPTAPNSAAHPTTPTRQKPGKVQPSVLDPEEPDLLHYEKLESEFTFSVKMPRAAVLSVDSLLHLAEDRLNSRPRVPAFEDLSIIPPLIDVNSESTDRAEVNLVDLIRSTPRDRRQLPIPLPRTQSVKRLEINLRTRSNRPRRQSDNK
jgi:hypothetical protein